LNLKHDPALAALAALEALAALAALAALQRAGLRAAHEALRTNTDMVIGKDGKIEHVSPQDYLRDRAESGATAA